MGQMKMWELKTRHGQKRRAEKHNIVKLQVTEVMQSPNHSMKINGVWP